MNPNIQGLRAEPVHLQVPNPQSDGLRYVLNYAFISLKPRQKFYEFLV